MSQEVVDFGIPGALNSPNGMCPISGHGTKINIDGIPSCLRCNAIAAKAAARPAGVVTIADPGVEAVAKLTPGAKVAGAQAASPVATSGQLNVTPPASFEDGLKQIVAQLEALPFPPDERAYRFVSKLKKRVSKFLLNEEGD